LSINLNNRNLALDLIRGIAALLVMMGHLRASMFISNLELKNSEQLSFAGKIFYFLTSQGHNSVIIFFVLSGFLVGGSIINNKSIFNFKTYVIKRLSRLWIPLFPVLILTFFVDRLISNINADVLKGGHHLFLNSGPLFDYSASLKTLLSNTFFFQGVFSPVYGSNGPLWSLANEFWYYILFPLILLSVGFLQKNIKIKITSILAAILIIAFVAHNMIAGFFIWCLGVLVFQINKKTERKIKPFIVIISGLFFTISLTLKYVINSDLILLLNDIIVGISFSFFLICLLKSSIIIKYSLFSKKLIVFLSEISYTLYIIHFPLILLIYTIFYSEGKKLLSFITGLEFFGWFSGILIVSIAFWYMFERRTVMIRAKILNYYKLKF